EGGDGAGQRDEAHRLAEDGAGAVAAEGDRLLWLWELLESAHCCIVLAVRAGSSVTALRERAVLALECDHEPAEEIVELILLACRERGRDDGLLLGLDGDRPLPDLA